MGGQGVGKGTFSAMLLAKNNFNYIETGAILRSLPPESDIRKIIAHGDLLPDEKLFELIESKINKSADNLIDGFPRTLGQAKWFTENYADKFNIHIIHLNISEELMLKRIQKRVREGGGRADDTDATAIRHRLDSFWKTTMPAINWLRDNDTINFTDINVSDDVNTNFAKIEKALK